MRRTRKINISYCIQSISCNCCFLLYFLQNFSTFSCPLPPIFCINIYPVLLSIICSWWRTESYIPQCLPLTLWMALILTMPCQLSCCLLQAVKTSNNNNNNNNKWLLWIYSNLLCGKGYIPKAVCKGCVSVAGSLYQVSLIWWWEGTRGCHFCFLQASETVFRVFYLFYFCFLTAVDLKGTMDWITGARVMIFISRATEVGLMLSALFTIEATVPFDNS